MGDPEHNLVKRRERWVREVAKASNTPVKDVVKTVVYMVHEDRPRAYRILSKFRNLAAPYGGTVGLEQKMNTVVEIEQHEPLERVANFLNKYGSLDEIEAILTEHQKIVAKKEQEAIMEGW